MKRALSLLLTLVLMLSLCGGGVLSALADETPTAQTTEAPAAEAPAEPAPEAPAEPTTETTAEPTTETTAEPTAETTAEPTAETTAEPTAETTAEPTAETTAEPTAETTAEPAEPAEEPTEEGVDRVDVLNRLDGASTYTQAAGLVVTEGTTPIYSMFGTVSGTSGSMFLNDDGTASIHPVAITGAAGSYVCSEINPRTVFTVSAGEGQNRFLLQVAGAGSAYYLYADGGQLKLSSSNGGYGHWGYKNNQLYYDVAGTKNYVSGWAAGGFTTTTDAAAAKTILLFCGTDAGGGGGGGGDTVDELAPVITAHPASYLRTVTDPGVLSTPEQFVFSVTAEPAEGAPDGTVLHYKWYYSDDGANFAAIDGTDANAYRPTLQFAQPSAASFYCEVSCEIDDGTGTMVTHTTVSQSGVLRVVFATDPVAPNTILMFSDVHGEYDNIAGLIDQFMALRNGKLPSLIIASGDLHKSGTADKETTLAEIEYILSRTIGIQTVFIAGNHDSGEAVVEYAASGAGVMKTDFDGCGVLYEADDYIVYGINYENEKEGYGDLSTEGSVTREIDQWLAGLSGTRAAKTIVFVSHTGLHMLDAWGGGASYNVDGQTALTDVLNRYAKSMTIGFYFGHNHSKGDTEFLKVPGDVITCVMSYTNQTTETRTLNFTYAHAGYLTTSIGAGTGGGLVLDAETSATILTRINSGAGGVTPPTPVPYTVEKASHDAVPVVSALLNAAYDLNETAEALTCTVSGMGDVGVSYQWYENTENLTDGGFPIPGELTDSYTPATDAVGVRYYYCKVTNDDNPDLFNTSTCAVITVTDPNAKLTGGFYPDADAMAANTVYVIGVLNGDGKTAQLVTNNADGTASAVTVPYELIDGVYYVDSKKVTDAMKWTPSAATGAYIQNGSNYLYYSKGTMQICTTTDSSKNKWSYSGTTLSYMAGKDTYYVKNAADGAFNLTKTSDEQTPVYLFLVRVFTGYEAGDAAYTKGSGKAVVMTCNGRLANFVGIEVDGVRVSPNDCPVTEGSTIASFSNEYLDGLAAGKHTVRFMYLDGDATADLTVSNKPVPPKKDSNVPNTGDDGMPVLWLGLILACGAALAVLPRKKHN